MNVRRAIRELFRCVHMWATVLTVQRCDDEGADARSEQPGGKRYVEHVLGVASVLFALQEQQNKQDIGNKLYTVRRYEVFRWETGQTSSEKVSS